MTGSGSGTGGTRALIAVLDAVGSGQPPGRLRADCARSTLFEAAAALEAAGLIARDAQGRLTPGQLGLRLHWARHDLGHLAGRAEAALDWLIEGTGCVATIAATASPEQALAGHPGEGAPTLEMPGMAGALVLRIWATRQDAEGRRALMARAAQALAALEEARAP